MPRRYPPQLITQLLLRTIGAVLVIPALLSAGAAFAEDVSSAKGAAAERKAELRQTAQQIKSTGSHSHGIADEIEYSIIEDFAKITRRFHTRIILVLNCTADARFSYHKQLHVRLGRLQRPKSNE